MDEAEFLRQLAEANDFHAGPSEPAEPSPGSRLFTSPEQLRDALAAANLSPDSVAVITSLAQPAFQLVTEEIPADWHSPNGASRLGGTPDLPPGSAWPWRPGYVGVRQVLDEPDDQPAPLSFLAQLDFADLAAAGTLPDVPLPTSGRLQLYYDLQRMPWGFDPAERIGVHVAYDDSPVSALSRTQPPSELFALGDEAILHEQMLRPQVIVSTPSPYAHAVRSRLAEPDIEALDEWYGEFWDLPEWNSHQVGGWPHQVQGEMPLDVALLAAGHYTGNIDVYRDEAAMAAAEADAPNWVLLWQLASEDPWFMWGDEGFLYLWIRRDDLAARRFDDTVLILQCY